MKHLAYFMLILLTCFEVTPAREYFVSKSTLNDGAHKIQIHIKNIRATQIVAGPREGSESGIVLRQISNGRQVVNLVYNGVPSYLKEIEGFDSNQLQEDPSLVPTEEEGLALRDCVVEKGKTQVRDFTDKFDNDSMDARDASHFDLSPTAALNVSYVIIHRSMNSLPDYLHPLMKFGQLKTTCFQLRRKIRQLSHHKKEGLSHSEDSKSLRRQRRGVTNILSIPHTKWCGTGYSATSYSELGGLYGADSCCRQHDLHCPFFIQSFERKYGYFNFGLGTMSHCSCDRRFKTCLKQSGTGASDVVGNVFFNIVKSHCFVFKRKRVCKKRGFWNCLKWGYEKQAVVRGPINWNL